MGNSCTWGFGGEFAVDYRFIVSGPQNDVRRGEKSDARTT